MSSSSIQMGQLSIIPGPRGDHRSPTRNGTCTAFIELDLASYKAIGRRVRIIVDQVILNYEESVRVCYRCCGYGDNADRCTKATVTCFHCASGDHQGRSCPTLANPRKANYSESRQDDHNELKTIGMIVKTYDGTVVPILGEVIVKVEFESKTSMLRAVVVKGEKKALMGREWINLLEIDYFAVNQIPSEISIAEFLKEHQVLFNDTAEPIKRFTFSMNIRDVSPIFHKARPVPFAIIMAITEALENMVTKGYLYRVTLSRFLNTAAYPLPTQQDLFAILAKGKYFSKLDLSSAYLQLEVATSTQLFLTINTHKGLFRFRRMPFGLANAPSYFHSVMDRVLAGIEGVICYIDDVLIATVSVEKHLAVLKTVFLRLEKYNIKLKKDKCKFVQREIEYLGHLIKEDGIRPLDHKVQAFTEGQGSDKHL
ncbi:K02A2.6-like [Cordylochernes scorpioides]|uniref:K02A2.6-like n=1 Tax=Cordylochernes scorpioides TaxID=51811 RepID=A0ABY6KZI3_9ARAC|nr:K02A2.6-like [Cordylochernes scorpioides]